MKKIYTLIILLFIVGYLNAQQTISFEAEEGYELGNLHNQKGWEVTEGADGILDNQVISDEKASDGIYAFKNAFEPDFDWQWFPIFGAAKTFDEPQDYTDFNISYDVLVTDKLGADFEFVAYTIIDDEFAPVAGVGIENQGQIYVIIDEDYDYFILDVEWEPNTWVNVRIEVNQEEVKYYINEELKHTIDNYTHSDIYGFNMLHNNYGHDAYYDNIKINTELLAIEDHMTQSIKLYPNPTTDFIHVQSIDKALIKEISVYNMIGKKLIVQKDSPIDLKALPVGTYILEIITVEGQSIMKKVIKK